MNNLNNQKIINALPKTTIVARANVKFLRALRKKSLSSQKLFNAALTSRAGIKSAVKASPTAAMMQIKSAVDTVPAFSNFLETTNFNDRKASHLTDAIGQLPETDKKQYIDNYSIAERCRFGVIPTMHAEIDESSGSSGKPYNWIRGTEELTEMRRTLSRLATFLYGENIVTINGFSMGAWATGTNVSMSLVANGLIKSTGPVPEKMLSVFQMLDTFRTYIVTGYPPFMLELIEYGLKQNFPWKDYKMIAIVGGEAMSETLRTRLLEYFETVTSAYGASDLDIGVACEFPLSTYIRQKAGENPELASKLFGDIRRMPMLFQYDPLDYFVEQNDSGELVVTVNRPTALSPRLRYNVHDNGGKLDFDYVLQTCKSFGFNPLKEAKLPYGGVHPRLPFLFVGGRSDSTISYLGANIYPEDIEQAIFGDAPKSDVENIKNFAMELVEHQYGQPQPCVYIELKSGVSVNTLDPEVISKRIVNRLIQNSRDFKASLAEDPKAGEIIVRLVDENQGPFAEMSKRIKRKYIIVTPKTETRHAA